jgi:hypothetical protein
VTRDRSRELFGSSICWGLTRLGVKARVRLRLAQVTLSLAHGYSWYTPRARDARGRLRAATVVGPSTITCLGTDRAMQQAVWPLRTVHHSMAWGREPLTEQDGGGAGIPSCGLSRAVVVVAYY